MKPILQALVLAERVYTDTSGKKIIAGTFNRLIVGKVERPIIEGRDGEKLHGLMGGIDPGCPMVYISLTDVIDGTELTLQMFNLSRNIRVFQTRVRIEEKDRLATVEIVAPLPRLSDFVKETGTLSFDVLWGDEILGSHRLRVEAASSSEGPNPLEGK